MEIAKSYDSMPYPSKFFLQTHPDQLATLASFFGLKPKRPEKCRVLELGCGNGSNLISHAYNLEDSTFVGIDISPNHIKSAEDSSTELKLSNIEFLAVDLMKMTEEEFGKFDYIIAHGLISWIPDVVLERVFSILREMLEPQGIGYMSYNAYPGCHYRDMVRNILRFHTRDINEPTEKVNKAIAKLAFLSENVTEKEIYQPILEHELKRHLKHEASDFYHDDLGDYYHPFYFHEFASKLDDNGLQFLSEAELHAMSIHDLSPEVQEFLNKTKSVVEREQYMDFFRGRIFRQSLICHKEVEIDRSPDPLDIEKFMVAAPITAQTEDVKLTEQTPVKFVGNKGFGLEIDHPLTKASLIHLGEIWGAAISVTTLLQTARHILENQGYKTQDWDQEFTAAKTILFRIVQGTDLVQLHTYVPKANQEVSGRPKLNGLARWQIGISKNVTTLFGLNIGIEDTVSAHLLYLLNGERKRSELIDQLEDFIKTNKSVENKDEILNELEDWLDQNLSQLAKTGLFVS